MTSTSTLWAFTTSFFANYLLSGYGPAMCSQSLTLKLFLSYVPHISFEYSHYVNLVICSFAFFFVFLPQYCPEITDEPAEQREPTDTTPEQISETQPEQNVCPLNKISIFAIFSCQPIQTFFFTHQQVNTRSKQKHFQSATADVAAAFTQSF